MKPYLLGLDSGNKVGSKEMAIRILSVVEVGNNLGET